MDINNTDDVVNLWTKLIKKYGVRPALAKAKEELAELIVAISHLECGKGSKFDVMDEVVDVQMQLEKITVMLKEDKYTKFYMSQRRKKYNYLGSILDE